MREAAMKINLLVLSLALYPISAAADDLTMMIEKDLSMLGYETGPVDGEETMQTVIAISKFQAENNLEVTGSVSPQLAGILSARAANPNSQSSAKVANRDPQPLAATDPVALREAQQACLQERVAATQAKQKKKRGFGRLLSIVARAAGRMGNNDLSRTTRDVYSASATADDLSAAAKDLGLTEDDAVACRNPT